MKKIVILIVTVFSFALWGCEGSQGPIGPMGPQGPEGKPGVNILGQVFEAVANFDAEYDFREFYDFPSYIGDNGQIYESDVVLMYILEGVNGNLDIWEPIPTMRFAGGNKMFQYSFDYSQIDFSIFIEGNFDLSTLGDNVTQEKIFRIAVIPADFAKMIDPANLADVMQKANISEADVIKLGN